MIGLLLLLATPPAGAVDPFPADVIVQAARTRPVEAVVDGDEAQAGDEAPATDEAPAEPAIERLPPRQAFAIQDLRAGRRQHRLGNAVGVGSLLATVSSIGLIARSVACDRPCDGLTTGGVLGLVGGFIGLEVGAVLALSGAHRERRALVDLGTPYVPDSALAVGWTAMVSQLLWPVAPLSLGGAYASARRQHVQNAEALRRYRRDLD